jgi:hypothetical protein
MEWELAEKFMAEIKEHGYADVATADALMEEMRRDPKKGLVLGGKILVLVGDPGDDFVAVYEAAIC